MTQVKTEAERGKSWVQLAALWTEALSVYAQISPHHIWHFDLQMQISLKGGSYAEINTQAHSFNNYFFQNTANHQVHMDSLGNC